ncbi:MAG: hypothetical protein WBE50_10410, partial [Methyloceanibacter sp.]
LWANPPWQAVLIAPTLPTLADFIANGTDSARNLEKCVAQVLVTLQIIRGQSQRSKLARQIVQSVTDRQRVQFNCALHRS